MGAWANTDYSGIARGIFEGRKHVDKEPRGITYVKNGRYYIRIYYYVDAKRKSKDYATGIPADDSSPRKAKQQERAANTKLADILQRFNSTQREKNDRNELMFTVTVDEWYAH